MGTTIGIYSAELNLLYLHKDTIGGFAQAYYWSSTDLGGSPHAYYAENQDLGTGSVKLNNLMPKASSWKIAYFQIVKTRINLNIEDSLLAKMKIYSKRQGKSVSKLVGDYFENLTQPAKKKKYYRLGRRVEKAWNESFYWFKRIVLPESS